MIIGRSFGRVPVVASRNGPAFGVAGVQQNVAAGKVEYGQTTDSEWPELIGSGFKSRSKTVYWLTQKGYFSKRTVSATVAVVVGVVTGQ